MQGSTQLKAGRSPDAQSWKNWALVRVRSCQSLRCFEPPRLSADIEIFWLGSMYAAQGSPLSSNSVKMLGSSKSQP